VVSLSTVSAALKLDRAERERQRLEREEEEKRAEEERRKWREYERKVEILRKVHKEWEESKSLAVFAEAFAKALSDGDVKEEIKNELLPIAEWSGRFATALNPLSRLEQIHKQFFPPPGSWWG
jgi:hypothetical protein